MLEQINKEFRLHSIFTLLIFCSISTYSQVRLQNGLKGIYFFNQKTNLNLPGAPNAVFNGANYAENRFGVENSAVTTDGFKEFLLIPTGSDWDLSSGQDYSISLWIRPQDGNPGCIILKEGAFGIKWNSMGRPLTIFNGLENGFPSGKFNNWSSNQWYHLLMVKSGNKARLYIDGQLDTEQALVKGKPLESKDIYLGRHPYFWGGFTGQIDDIILYQRALNEYEIQTLAQVENIPIEDLSTPVPIPDLSSFEGNWQGVLIQPGNQLVENFAYWIRFQKMEDNILYGYSRIELSDEIAYGVSKARGFISGNSLNFEEQQLVRQKNYRGFAWCKKFGQLVYDPKDKSLKGKWYSSNCKEGGTVLLYRTDNPFNHFDNRLSEKVSIDKLVAELEKEEKSEFLKEKVLTLDINPIHFPTGSYVLPENEKNYLEKEILPLLQ